MTEFAKVEDVTALKRALRNERATNKLYSRKLRELMTTRAYVEFQRFCRVTVNAGCRGRMILADATGEKVKDA